ncbi:hypothetical protein JMA_04250 [Jeotgalibacillus malaysiensis]|uniref:Uncharacterized protein n=1 Tax=Jeotgalibacillus malaysiensis TaxID=1508404 RepID=A0A0B5AM43_9BACL|nr:hypothetical protein [Jeotgalibacillus malaysiensis]AJD89742.1 hypothetical protein JMA_04250 [Jeotgalibacillus malaysiensis]
MGFYYFIILFIGIFCIFLAVYQGYKGKSLLQRKVIITGITGVLLVGLAMYLFTPGSSEMIAELLNLN